VRWTTYPNTDIESWRNDTALVDAPDEIDNNLTGAVVIENFELANVSWKESMEKNWKGIGPFFCITWRNLTITFEEGLIITWRFPRFSAFDIVLRQSARTLILVIYNHHKRGKRISKMRSLQRKKWREMDVERIVSEILCSGIFMEKGRVRSVGSSTFVRFVLLSLAPHQSAAPSSSETSPPPQLRRILNRQN
jgi:hypothetical protein